MYNFVKIYKCSFCFYEMQNAPPNLAYLTNLFRLGKKVHFGKASGKSESRKRVPGIGNLNSWHSLSVYSFSLMICSYSRTYFSRMTRFMW